jgi:CubicO group peptidase (beta-lactamase class C family)
MIDQSPSRTHRIPVLCAVVLVASLATGCNSDGAPEAPSGCDALDFSAFDTAVSTFLSQNGLQGASGVVVHKDCGVVHVQGYGAFASDRIYLVGSSSKIVSTGVVMRLADQGRVDIDAPIGNQVAAWGAAGKPELQVAQLLSNSSGLVSLADNPFYRPYNCQYRTGGTLNDCAEAIYTADDAAERIPPDTEFHYGGGQWQLAGGVAQVVSAKPWNTLLQETYVDPCGTQSLGFSNPFSSGGFSYPPSFQGDPANLPATENPSVEGGLYIDAADYGQLLLMHLRDGACPHGRVMSANATQRMRQDRIQQVYGGTASVPTGGTTGADAFQGYGLGWWIDRTHPGVFADPGLYGAFPWLDLNRGYGAFLAIEATGPTGAALFGASKPALDAAFDAALGAP